MGGGSGGNVWLRARPMRPHRQLHSLATIPLAAGRGMEGQGARRAGGWGMEGQVRRNDHLLIPIDLKFTSLASKGVGLSVQERHSGIDRTTGASGTAGDPPIVEIEPSMLLCLAG